MMIKQHSISKRTGQRPASFNAKQEEGEKRVLPQTAVLGLTSPTDGMTSQWQRKYCDNMEIVCVM